MKNLLLTISSVLSFLLVLKGAGRIYEKMTGGDAESAPALGSMRSQAVGPIRCGRSLPPTAGALG